MWPVYTLEQLAILVEVEAANQAAAERGRAAEAAMTSDQKLARSEALAAAQWGRNADNSRWVQSIGTLDGSRW